MFDNAVKTRLCGSRRTTGEDLLWMATCLLSALILLSWPRTGRAEPAALPRVIMVEIPDVTTNDASFYEAILAQLSAASLRLERLTVEDPRSMTADPLAGASTLAADRGADMLFWIRHEGTVYTIFFYISHASERTIHSREMDLSSENQLSRVDTVGNAVSSLIEESFPVPKKHERTDSVQSRPRRETQPSPPRPPSESRDLGRKWVNLFALYAGSFFEHRTVTHGVRIGMGLLPIEHIAIALSYTQGFPVAWDTERYRLSLVPRTIEASFAGRWVFDFVELRLGISWSVELRSYSMSSSSEDITPRPDDMSVIHSISPFAVAIWNLSEAFGIVTGLGASIAVNEKDYVILRSDDSEVFVLEPFYSKLSYQVGLLVQL